jgi:hypothetical protein
MLTFNCWLKVTTPFHIPQMELGLWFPHNLTSLLFPDFLIPFILASLCPLGIYEIQAWGKVEDSLQIQKDIYPLRYP